MKISQTVYRLYAGVFKICAKGFWFSATALFNNWTIFFFSTIKQFSRLFFIEDNFGFMNKCDIVISYETLFVRNGFMNFRKLLLVVKLFSVSFLKWFFIHFLFNYTHKISFLFICHFVFFWRIFAYFTFQPGSGINSFSELFIYERCIITYCYFRF